MVRFCWKIGITIVFMIVFCVPFGFCQRVGKHIMLSYRQQKSQVIAKRFSREKVYQISLEEATRIALANNFDVQLAQYDALISKTGEGAAVSIYDTILTTEIKYHDNQKKQSSTIFGTKTVDNDYNIGVSKKLSTGTTLGLDMTNNRSANNSVFSASPVTHDSTLTMNVEQALGKNFFGIQDKGDIKITKLDIASAKYTSIEKIETSIAQVQKAYWDLVLQKEKITIQKVMVQHAKRLYDLHQEKLQDGLVELPDVIASEANYAKQENELIFLDGQFVTRMNILKLLLNIEQRGSVLEPSAELNLLAFEETSQTALKSAFEYRQDYKKAANVIKRQDVGVAMKNNNMWPEIDLTATFARNGLGDHFKQAVTQISNQYNPNFSAGLIVRFPLENREAKAQLKAAELEKARALIAFKLVERQIVTDIMTQIKDCRVFHEVALNSGKIAKLQARKLEEEEKRFGMGRSNTDTLIRFQEDLVRARDEEAEAKHRYLNAIIDLQYKSGILFNKYWQEDL